MQVAKSRARSHSAALRAGKGVLLGKLPPQRGLFLHDQFVLSTAARLSNWACGSAGLRAPYGDISRRRLNSFPPKGEGRADRSASPGRHLAASRRHDTPSSAANKENVTTFFPKAPSSGPNRCRFRNGGRRRIFSRPSEGGWRPIALIIRRFVGPSAQLPSRWSTAAWLRLHGHGDFTPAHSRA